MWRFRTLGSLTEVRSVIEYGRIRERDVGSSTFSINTFGKILMFNCLAEEGCSELEEGVAGGAEGGESRVVGVREDLGEKFGWETGHEVEKSRS
jgi:hypothetical protein